MHTVTAWDDQGRPLSWVTETEPEYDDDERDGWVALRQYEQTICPNCGNPRSVCENSETPFYPQLTHCWATAAREVATRKWSQKNEGVKPDAAGYLPDDGTFLWVSTDDLSPGDDFI